jgi:hypothetical protein
MWKLWACLGLAGVVGGFAAGWQVHGWRDASGELTAANAALGVAEHAGLVSQLAAVADQRAEDRVRTVTRIILQKVPEYVTPADDARFPLPWGFVRLHDAAAAGADLSAAAPGSGWPDGAASDVTASGAAAVIAANYGDCRADQARLAALQGWARGEGLAK